MRQHTRFRAFLIVASLYGLAAACDQPTEPRQPDVSGVYALAAIGGQPLPVQYYYSEQYDTRSDYVGGDLVLQP